MAKYGENANEQEIEVLEGIIEHIIYTNEENGYTVLDRVRDFNQTERALLARYDRKEE